MSFERFLVAGHDRGGRVAHRMALDHPEQVAKVAFLDIVRTPILGGVPAASSWPIAAAVTLVLGLLASAAYAAWRQRIVYWI